MESPSPEGRYQGTVVALSDPKVLAQKGAAAAARFQKGQSS